MAGQPKVESVRVSEFVIIRLQSNWSGSLLLNPIVEQEEIFRIS